ncbi:hypothetical protein [Ruminococcus sp.]|uniref:hypothetical protein n=1 Tax=Ruminococcus sp. TaxID=41978 RepID=UPI0026001419|nr:hypothetical protein [Ruminococcus sp.]MBQ9542685.1 hypothetical protein [Ruminococcus sp.]
MQFFDLGLKLFVLSRQFFVLLYRQYLVNVWFFLVVVIFCQQCLDFVSSDAVLDGSLVYLL